MTSWKDIVVVQDRDDISFLPKKWKEVDGWMKRWMGRWIDGWVVDWMVG